MPGIEVLIIILLIAIAIITNYFQGRKRALRQEKLDYEYAMKLKDWEENRIAAHKKQLLLKTASHLPQDSTLRRHYLSNLRVIIKSLSPPRPTDCVLNRHYDSLITSELDKCMDDERHIKKLFRNYANHKKTFAEKKKRTSQLQSTANVLIKSGQARKPEIPEDSMLRRHFIANLWAGIESTKPPRPTDCVLRRHYMTMIKTELNMQLMEMGI